jgi:hypothetical protein
MGNTPQTHLMTFKQLGVLAGLSWLVALGAQAQAVHLYFSGGNGTPLTVQFVDSLTLTTTQATSTVRLALHGIYNGSVGNGDIAPTSPLDWPYTVNGVADGREDQGAHPLYDWDTPGYSPTDFLINISQDVTNTNAITSGSVYYFPASFSFTTGTSNWASNPADYSATFTVYLTNAFGGRISAIQAGAIGAAAVPEPATTALVVSGVALLVAGLVRRKRASR